MIKYAPYIDGTIPAFTADSGIKVPFQPNLAVGEVAAAGMVLMVKDLNGNVIDHKEPIKVENNIAEFQGPTYLELKVNEYVAMNGGSHVFLDLEGEYIVNEIGNTSILIINNENKELTYSRLSIVFKESNKDLISKITVGDSVKINSNDDIIITDGKIKIGQYYKLQLAYSDTDEDIEYNDLTYSSIGVTKYIGDITYYIENVDKATGKVTTKYIHDSDPTEIEYKEEIFLDGDLVDPNNMTFIKGKNYEITARLTTINGYIAEAVYKLKSGSNNGIANLYSFKPSMDIEYGEINAIIPQDYSAIRSKSFDSYENIILPDNTVEHGEIYYYGLKDQEGNWRLKEEPIEVEFEDMFLQDKNHILRIKFNPKVSSFKRAIQESKITTLGSKYPFFFRKGDQNFAEFSINGLLSYYMQDSGKFVYDYDLGLEGAYTRPRGADAIVQLYEDSNGTVGGQLSLDGGMTLNDSIRQSRTTNLVNYNIHAERKYRDLVYNWLNNGQPKLFRSPTEGNFVVRLMDINMSPEDQLGRMLYNFSCSATECAAADDYTTLKKLNLV